MESSKEVGNGEECNSGTESGWTKYLCSPKNSDESDVDDGEIKVDIEYEKKHDEYESDDSMASDASSGPVRLVHSWGNNEIGNDLFGHKVIAEDKMGGNCFTNKKAKYHKQENQESGFTANEAKLSAKSNVKVRKTTSWFGKGK